jgi:hypothetical protein
MIFENGGGLGMVVISSRPAFPIKQRAAAVVLAEMSFIARESESLPVERPIGTLEAGLGAMHGE